MICTSMAGHNTNTIEHTRPQHLNFRALAAWAVNTSVTCFLTWRTKDNKRLDFIGKENTVRAKHLCKLANDHNFAMEDHNETTPIALMTMGNFTLSFLWLHWLPKVFLRANCQCSCTISPAWQTWPDDYSDHKSLMA